MIFHPRKWLEPHLVDALDALRFELHALKGRWMSKRRADLSGREYLQLGSGESRLDGFLNSDFPLNDKAELHLDARFPLPFRDQCLRGIYAHHVVEHLSYEDARALFKECCRVLKPGGIFRMVVPDLEVFLRCYTDPDPQKRAKIYRLLPEHFMAELAGRTPLEVADHIFRDNKFNRHLSAWDWETAALRLREAGFASVQRLSANQSADPMLAGHDKTHWADHSLYVEATK